MSPIAAKVWFKRWVKYLESNPIPSECYRRLCNLDSEGIDMLYRDMLHQGGTEHKWGNKVQGILDHYGIEVTQADVRECIHSIIMDCGYPLPANADRRF